MTQRPIVLIHGYSATSKAFDKWREILAEWGYPPELIHVCNYISLSDEVTVPHLAQAFDEALKSQPGLNKDEPFDAIVHSTGMLVLRTWAVLYPHSRKRLKHLIGLAPASFGSPLAHKGRSYLGRAIRGNPVQGPDFREAGDKILDALELGSEYTWDLALQDLVGDDRFYGCSGNSPFVAVFCGTDGYKGLMSVVNEPGTDGTVRLSGAALNTRKFELDLRASVELGKRERLRVAEWSNSDIPVVAIEGVDHSSIMVAPTQELKQFVRGALGVRTKAEHEAWLESVRAHNQKVTASQGRSWQQLIVRVVDGHDQPVEAYFIDFHFKKGTEWVSALSQDVPVSVHAYSTDNSFRCFHVDLDKLLPLGDEWALTVRVVTGTRFTRAVGWIDRGLKTLATDLNACAAVRLANRGGVEFFFPNTTTLIEIRIDQEPIEDEDGVRLVDFTDRRERIEAEEKRAREAARAAIEKEEAERTARLDELEAGFVRQRENLKR